MPKNDSAQRRERRARKRKLVSGLYAQSQSSGYGVRLIFSEAEIDRLSEIHHETRRRIKELNEMVPESARIPSMSISEMFARMVQIGINEWAKKFAPHHVDETLDPPAPRPDKNQYRNN